MIFRSRDEYGVDGVESQRPYPVKVTTQRVFGIPRLTTRFLAAGGDLYVTKRSKESEYIKITM